MHPRHPLLFRFPRGKRDRWRKPSRIIGKWRPAKSEGDFDEEAEPRFVLIRFLAGASRSFLPGELLLRNGIGCRSLTRLEAGMGLSLPPKLRPSNARWQRATGSISRPRWGAFRASQALCFLGRSS